LQQGRYPIIFIDIKPVLADPPLPIGRQAGPSLPGKEGNFLIGFGSTEKASGYNWWN